MGVSVNLSDELVGRARVVGRAKERSIAKQIEYWAKIGHAAEENPDLSVGYIEKLFLALEEKAEPFDFNDLEKEAEPFSFAEFD